MSDFFQTNDPIMKRIFLQTIVVVFVVTAVVSCTRKPTIYANHDITACGVKDPLVNVKWLADKCEEIKKGKAKEVTISLLKDTVTQDNAFMISYRYKQKGKEIYSSDGYDCLGKWLYGFRSGMLYGFRSGMMPFPPEEKEKFFKNKTDLGVIFKFSFK